MVDEEADSTVVTIGSSTIGTGYPTYVIAEAGSNHDGDFGVARKLIDVAADAGCDAVKFQVFSAHQLMAPGGPTAAYLKDEVGTGGLYELFEYMAMDRDWLSALAAHCESRSIHLLATPFDTDAVAQIAAVGVPAMKNASSELWHIPLIEAQAATGLPVILSTGMSDLGDIQSAVDAAKKAGATQLALMQCTVSYPTPPDQVNLAAMDTLRSTFACPVGLSDHTTGLWAPVAAVARGADLIEKHFTIDREMPGPDHRFAIEPDELRSMVEAVRATEVAIGSATKSRVGVEEEIFRIGRRNLVTTRKLDPGHVISADDVSVLRSALGIAPKHLDEVLGMTTRRSLSAHSPLQWEDLS